MLPYSRRGAGVTAIGQDSYRSYVIRVLDASITPISFARSGSLKGEHEVGRATESVQRRRRGSFDETGFVVPKNRLTLRRDDVGS